MSNIDFRRDWSKPREIRIVRIYRVWAVNQYEAMRQLHESEDKGESLMVTEFEGKDREKGNSWFSSFKKQVTGK